MNTDSKVAYLLGIIFLAIFFLILQIFFVPYQGQIVIPLLFTFLVILVYAIYIARVYPEHIADFLIFYLGGVPIVASVMFVFWSFGLFALEAHSCIWFPLVEVSDSMLLWYLSNFYALGAIVFVFLEMKDMINEEKESLDEESS